MGLFQPKVFEGNGLFQGAGTTSSATLILKIDLQASIRLLRLGP